MDECSTVVLLMYGVVKEHLTTDFLQLILGRIQDNSFPKIMVAFWYSIQNTKKCLTCCLITLLQRSISGSGSGSSPPIYYIWLFELSWMEVIEPTQVFHCDLAVAPYCRDYRVNLCPVLILEKSFFNKHHQWFIICNGKNIGQPSFPGVHGARHQEIVLRRRKRGCPPPYQAQLKVEAWHSWCWSQVLGGCLKTHWETCPALRRSRQRQGSVDKSLQTGFCWKTQGFNFYSWKKPNVGKFGEILWEFEGCVRRCWLFSVGWGGLQLIPLGLSSDWRRWIFSGPVINRKHNHNFLCILLGLLTALFSL